MARPHALGRFGRCFLAGQVAFAALMLCCIGIEPSWLAVARGLSYYGNHLATLAPYLGAYVACMSLTVLGLRGLGATGDAGRRRRALGLMLALIMGVAVTPYSVDLLFDRLHIVVATMLFVARYGVAAWLTLRLLRSTCAFALMAALIVAAFTIATGQARQLNWARLTRGDRGAMVRFCSVFCLTPLRPGL
jgi:hypothetical protein